MKKAFMISKNYSDFVQKKKANWLQTYNIHVILLQKTWIGFSAISVPESAQLPLRLSLLNVVKNNSKLYI